MDHSAAGSEESRGNSRINTQHICSPAETAPPFLPGWKRNEGKTVKVLIGQFNTESNGNVPYKSDITAYDLAFGEQCVKKMQVGQIFADAGIDVIPAIYAVAGAAGIIRREAFDYIEACFLKAVREHLYEIDGMYLMLHGAGEVEGLGSAEHHVLEEIRKITGPYLPIMVVCDPHGNLSESYVHQTTLIRSYRESPHTDKIESWHRVASELCAFLRNRQNIRPAYRKLPLILGGEQSVSTDEPVLSINRYMDELEQDPRIRSCSWHVGYIRHDTPVAGCGVVVVPQNTENQNYAEEIADRLAEFVWQRRHEFHYTGLTAQPEEALQMALSAPVGPSVITDSGDNTTAGAPGWNTMILRQVLSCADRKKSFLFAPICDQTAYGLACSAAQGERLSLALGVGKDTMSEPVTLQVRVGNRGNIWKYVGDKKDHVVGQGVLLHVQMEPALDVLVTSTGYPIIVEQQLQELGIDWTKYDVTVLKQGYIFPHFKQKAGFNVMSLTDGATPQDTAHIPFKRIMRPMYPIDNI